MTLEAKEELHEQIVARLIWIRLLICIGVGVIGAGFLCIAISYILFVKGIL